MSRPQGGWHLQPTTASKRCLACGSVGSRQYGLTKMALQLLSAHLQQADPVMYEIIENVSFSSILQQSAGVLLTGMSAQEKKRQKHFINLIPSENFTSQAVLDALGSPMQSAYMGPSERASEYHNMQRAREVGADGHFRQILGRLSRGEVLWRQ